jgi:hypothetical protein
MQSSFFWGGIWTLLVGSLSLWHTPLYAQRTKIIPYTLEASLSRGYLWNSQDNVRHLTSQAPSAVRLAAYRTTDGSADWHSSYRYPKFGLLMQYTDYNNPTLGRTLALIPVMEFTWVERPKSSLHFQIGSGLCYADNPFDLTDNEQNTMLGGALNAAMIFSITYQQRLSQQLSLRLGTELVHYSSGAYHLPNAGMNMHMFTAGLRYQPPRNPPLDRPAKSSTDLSKSSPWFVHTAAIGSAVSRTAGDPKRYAIFNLMIGAGKQLGQRSLLTTGVEYSHSQLHYAEMNARYNIGAIEQLSDFRRVALFVSHDWLVGPWALYTQVGWYVYHPFDAIDTALYQRLAIRYYPPKTGYRWLGHFGIKTHYGAAEAIELGLGYHWKKR